MADGTPGPVLEITYDSRVRWPLSLRSAIEANPALKARDAAWRDGELSDLAFAVSTRLGYMPDLIDGIDTSVRALDEQLRGKDAIVDRLRLCGYGFTFDDYAPVHRLLIAVDSFIVESRACFEQLARFYKRCLLVYCNEGISEPAAYEFVARVSGIPDWVPELRDRRHAVLHARALWLAFEVREAESPRYEPLFLLNWRPGSFNPAECVTFSILRRVGVGLRTASAALESELIARIQAPSGSKPMSDEKDA